MCAVGGLKAYFQKCDLPSFYHLNCRFSRQRQGVSFLCKIQILTRNSPSQYLKR